MVLVAQPPLSPMCGMSATIRPTQQVFRVELFDIAKKDDPEALELRLLGVHQAMFPVGTKNLVARA